MIRGRVARLAVSALAVAAALAVPGGAAAATRDANAAPRLVTITIPARHADIDPKWLPYEGPPRANVLLPASYDAHRRYPLIVALHGLNCNYAWWQQWKLTAPFERLHAIVVMPEGASGWYTDWWNHGLRGKPSWETYELDDVIPTVLRRYPILPQRRWHALVGISMGGLGAAYLGGRLPGFFGTVASLSGFVDPQLAGAVADPAMTETALAPLKGNYNPYAVDGRPHGFYMTGHNPTRLVMNLRQTRVFVSSGDGRPSAYAGLNHPGSEEEGAVIYPMNQQYAPALVAAGVNVTYQPHTGGHDIPDFMQEVKAFVRWGVFAPVVTHPKHWVNDTVATHGQLWNVGYRFAQPPTKVVQFQRVGRRLTVSGAGSSVTLTWPGGCATRITTPGTVKIPTHVLVCDG
ncbi:MAG TPA: alpha/beta hydrolase-fold protein [Mycobacteriales bacterium]|nr:alpha/beta hydrolase-fold protein [Mycobacteriales bacterium]